LQRLGAEKPPLRQAAGRWAIFCLKKRKN